MAPAAFSFFSATPRVLINLDPVIWRMEDEIRVTFGTADVRNPLVAKRAHDRHRSCYRAVFRHGRRVDWWTTGRPAHGQNVLAIDLHLFGDVVDNVRDELLRGESGFFRIGLVGWPDHILFVVPDRCDELDAEVMLRCLIGVNSLAERIEICASVSTRQDQQQLESVGGNGLIPVATDQEVFLLLVVTHLQVFVSESGRRDGLASTWPANRRRNDGVTAVIGVKPVMLDPAVEYLVQSPNSAASRSELRSHGYY